MEKKPGSSNIENAFESDEKSSSLPRDDAPETSIVQASPNMEDDISQSSQSDITEEQPKSTNVEISNECNEKSSSPSISSHDVPETSIEQIPLNQEDFMSQASQSDITEEQPKSTNMEKNNESDKKSSSPSIPSHDIPETSIEQIPSNEEDFMSQPSQSDITEEQPKSTNVEISNESNEKSSSPSTSSHDVSETSIEQIPSNQEDFMSQPSQSDITEEQPKSTNMEKYESDKKSSSPSIPSHDISETSIEQIPSNQEDFMSQLSQSDITEEQPKSTNVEISNESNEKSSSPSIPSRDVPETSIEQAPSNQEDFISQSSQTDITEEQPKSTNVEKSNESDEKSSSPFIPSRDVPETSIEQAPSNQEDFISQSSQTDITEEQPKSTNVEKSNESDEKSSSPYISSHDVSETSIEQAPSSQEDFISCQKPQGIDKIPSFKSADDPVENSVVKNSTNSTTNVFDNPNILSTSHSDGQAIKTVDDEKFIKFAESDIIEIEQTNAYSKYIGELKFQSLQQRIHKINILSFKSAEAPVENLQVQKSTDSTTNAHDIANILSTFISDNRPKIESEKNEKFMDAMDSPEWLSTLIIEDRQREENHESLETTTESVKFIPPKHRITDKAQKYEEQCPDKIKKEIKSSSKCLILLSFIISQILFLFLFLLLLYHFKSLDTNKNDEFVDSFATAIIELEEEILDHNATVRVFTEYLERDTSPLKVIALVVKDIFIEANIIMKIIPFKPLSEEALEKYIINAAENIGQTLSQNQIDYHKRLLIEDFIDCNKKYGCYNDHI
ncbi:hypothetical protein ACFW04_002482 [Cataglyphis niger]